MNRVLRSGSHCPVVPQPPLENNFVFTIQKGSPLLLLTSTCDSVSFVRARFSSLPFRLQRVQPRPAVHPASPPELRRGPGTPIDRLLPGDREHRADPEDHRRHRPGRVRGRVGPHRRSRYNAQRAELCQLTSQGHPPSKIINMPSILPHRIFPKRS